MKRNISVENAMCAICDESNSSHMYQVVEHEYPDTTDDLFSIHRCNTCNLFFLNPRPSHNELETIYPPNYYAFSLSESTSNKSPLNAKRISDFFERRRIKRIINLFHPSTVESVLDIGCGDGSDLDMFRDVLGIEVLTVGIEPSRAAAESASSRGHDVYVGTFPGDFPIKEKFDLIWSKHVIEHVASPAEFLRQIGSLLNEDGLVVLDTPNTDSPLRKLFGKHWGGWHTPRHWYLFDPPTIGVLAKKTGFDVCQNLQLPINAFWVWSLHSLIFKSNRRLADKYLNPSTSSTSGGLMLILMILFHILELLLRLVFRKTGQMRVVLKKSKSLTS